MRKSHVLVQVVTQQSPRHPEGKNFCAEECTFMSVSGCVLFRDKLNSNRPSILEYDINFLAYRRHRRCLSAEKRANGGE